MDKDKWRDIVHEELGNMNGQVIDEPEGWPVIKESIKEFIKKVDEVTEVYNEENKQKESK